MTTTEYNKSFIQRNKVLILILLACLLIALSFYFLTNDYFRDTNKKVTIGIYPDETIILENGTILFKEDGVPKKV